MRASEIKKRLHEYVDHADDTLLMTAYDMFQAHEGADWWHSLPKEAKASFEQGVDELRNGQFTPANEVMERIRKDFLHS